MKKILVIALAVVLCLGLAACENPFIFLPAPAPDDTRPAEVTPAPADTAEAPETTETLEVTETPGDDGLPVDTDPPAADFTRIDIVDTLQYDIDGDGAEETITLISGPSEEDPYMNHVTIIVSRDGVELDSFSVEYIFEEICFIEDLTAADSYKEIFLCGDLGSVDYATYALRLVDGKLLWSEVLGEVRNVTEGEIETDMIVNILGTHGAYGSFTLADDAALTFNSPEVYTVTFSVSDSEDEYNLKVLKALPVQLLNGETWQDGTLEPNTRLKLISTDEDSWCVCLTEEGTTVKISGNMPDDSWEWQIEGEPESMWFSGLAYAG